VTNRSRYAASTTVSTGRSRDELEALLRKYGVQHHGLITQPDLLTLAFQSDGLNHRIVLPLPSPADRRFRTGPGGGTRTSKGAQDAHAQEVRARYRALVLVVKAKLELAHLLGQPVEAAFTEYRVLDDGRTVQEHVHGQGQPPALTWGAS
jgi:hypothetical protein